ncbi:MAG: hypothetical protein GXO09_01480 [Crenarchaeota archaeon]|nr:hypothetical protein [Thermoproteota archaeon]
MEASYIAAELIEHRRVARDTAILAYRLLEEPQRQPLPGQFYMFHVPGVEAVPLSVYNYSQRTIWFLVKERGETTRIIVEEAPRRIGLLGPLGKPLPPPPRGGRALLLAGGVGVAPLAFYARHHPSTLLLGVRSREYYFDTGIGCVLVASDDGSIGVRGTVIEAIDSYRIEPASYSLIIAAGPTPMLCAAYAEMKRRGVLGKTILVLEEETICGLGFCGSCLIPGTSLRLCREGPGVEARLLSSWFQARCKAC